MPNIAGTELHKQTSLWGISCKAKQDKKYRFGNLYGMINKIALHQAWRDVKKDSSAGIDKETAEGFKENLEENLEDLLMDRSLFYNFQ